ncbi:hypothetical protein CMI37_00730 [Candidatus Pacearchaeota archaeon]|nr:hypothetical protein [Candidatus Pacearchaeota archaeon]|tara:strand:- start:2515 stop:2712 length:198 start_codon:yes stop_codon:yes gene_type:complete
MFSWFKKKEEFYEEPQQSVPHDDEIEEALWEMKERYDLATEEVQLTVADKRKNIAHMRKAIKGLK